MAAAVLGVLLLVMVLVPFTVAAVMTGDQPGWGGSLVVAALAALPMVLIAEGIRFLRRPPELQALQLTVTSDEIIIPEHRRVSVVDMPRPELRWPRESTEAKLLPARGALPARLRLKRTDRVALARYWRADVLDTAPQVIIEAINGRAPGTV